MRDRRADRRERRAERLIAKLEDSPSEDVAWDIIRLAMKEIVDNENKVDPLSDEALVEELAKRGYNLARRPVTKYRKAMHIPSSRERRQY